MSRARRVAHSLRRAAAATGSAAVATARLARDNAHYVIPGITGAVSTRVRGAVTPADFTMAWRLKNRNATTAEILAAQEPGRRAIVVAVHGLMGNEHNFEDEQTHGPRLRREAQVGVLPVRYDSGRHISDNGQALAQLLAELDSLLPAQLPLVLLGHSMGGLVLQSAIYYGMQQAAPWTHRVRALITLSTPHQGAPMERIGHLLAAVMSTLWTVPTRIIGLLGNERSDGIKDLRFGIVVEDDWRHPQAGHVLPPRTRVPVLPHAAYWLVAGQLGTKEPNGAMRLLGDGIVTTHSATTLYCSGTPQSLQTRVIRDTAHTPMLWNPHAYELVLHAVQQAVAA